MQISILNILALLIGSGGIFAFIQFIIKRNDQKKDITKDILKAVAETNEKIDKLKASIQQDKATTARTRILRFSDQLYSNVGHSKDYFEQILDDIEQYTQYCEKNPQFQNGRTKTACQCVNNEYIRLFKQHKLERRNQ